LHGVQHPRARAPLRIRLEESKLSQVLHLERPEVTTWTIRTQVVVNEYAVSIDRLCRLIEHHGRVVVRDGYGLPRDKPKRVSVMSVGPSVIVFPGAIFLLIDAVKARVQIDLERTARFVAYRNRRQDERAVGFPRVGRVEHLQARAFAPER